MPNEASKPGEVLAIPLVRMSDPNKPTIYCNNVFLAATQWDIQLYISTIQETEPGKFMSVDKALVVMTPEHALRLAAVLQNTVENYAKANGAVRDIKPIQSPK